MTPRTRRLLSSTAVLLPLLVLACASSGKRNVDPYATAAGEGQIHVKILNQNYYDAAIWVVVRGARQQKLGVVTGKQNAEFSMPWTFSAPMQLEIDLVTGNMRCRTDALAVDPGDVLELQITANFGETRGCRLGDAVPLPAG